MFNKLMILKSSGFFCVPFSPTSLQPLILLTTIPSSSVFLLLQWNWNFFPHLLWVGVKVAQSCLTLWDPMDHTGQILYGQNTSGQNTGVGRLSPLQGISSSQGLNPGLPFSGQILYQLSHKGSPRTLEWVARPFSSWSSQPRNWTGVSCIAGGFFTNWAATEAHLLITSF